MRRAKIANKLLSLILSAALAMTSADFAGISITANAETLDGIETVSENQVIDTEETETKESETQNETEEISVNEDAADSETEAEATVESEKEETEAETDETEIEDVEDQDDIAPEQVSDTDLVSGLVEDATLRSILLNLYNAQNSTTLSADEFQYQHLKTIETIDLTDDTLVDATDAAKITSIKGLGYADAATLVNVSNTSITEIEDDEFSFNCELVTVIVSDDIKGLGKNAFSDCENLENFNVVKNGEVKENTLPSKLVDVLTGSEVFKGCKALKSFTIDCENGAAIQKAAGMFSGCSGLTEVNITKTIVNIPTNFLNSAGSKDGMTVKIEDGSKLSIIESGAFQNANLAVLDLSMCKELSRIGDKAFMVGLSYKAGMVKDSIRLKELVLPATVSGTLEMGDEIFYKAPLAKMYISESGINEEAEEGVIVIPDYVTSLGKAAFYENTMMTNLTLSAKLDGIQGYSFFRCTELQKVTTSTIDGKNAIRYIDDAAFFNTTMLEDALFLGKMNQLTRIGERDLKTIYDDKNVAAADYEKYVNKQYEKMGGYVFWNSHISAAEFPASLRVINSRSFTDTSLKSVLWNTDANLQAGSEYKIASEAVSTNKELVSFIYPNTGSTDVQFNIGIQAFEGNSSLVEFHDASIAKGAEASKNALPIALNTLGTEAFIGCSSLPSISIKDNIQGKCPELGVSVFKYCTKLAYAELPASIESIPAGFFYDAQLKAFPTIAANPAKVKTIGSAAFFGNAMSTADLSNLKELTKIEARAFGYVDTTVKPDPYYAAITVDMSPSLNKVILPSGIKEMSWGDSIFTGARNLKTINVDGYAGNQDGVVVIPSYLPNKNCAGGAFSMAGIEKVHWQYTSDGNNPWTYIPSAMFNATMLKTLEDGCIPADDLVEIGANAYAACLFSTIDLRSEKGYINLTKVGEGTFSECLLVESIYLPDNDICNKVEKNTFRIGTFGSLVISDGIFVSLLKKIDFGKVKEIGDYAFASYSEVKMGAASPGDTHLTALEEVSFEGARVTSLGTGAFRGQPLLKDLNLAGVETIGDYAFEKCYSLNMNNKPMADSVQKIGKYTFSKCESLGNVVVGKGLVSIGDYAFAKSAVIDDKAKTMEAKGGLQSIDLTPATDLGAVGTGAFSETPMIKATIDNELVTVLNSNVFSSCPYLKEVELGTNIKQVKANALSGCVRLQQVVFDSATTMDAATFNAAGIYVNDDNYKFTPINAVTLKCKAGNLTVALDRCTKFPYFVKPYKKGEVLKFKEMYIGDSKNPDTEVYKYIKVRANTDGYFVNIKDDAHRIQNVASDATNYYETMGEQDMVYTTDSGLQVSTFELYGLQETPGDTTIPFVITNDFVFTSADKAIGSVNKDISLEYQLKVKDIPYHAVLYTDMNRNEVEKVNYNAETGIATMDKLVRANKANTTGKLVYYYDIQNVKESGSRPDNCNLIVQSSNPDVVTVTTVKNVVSQVEGKTNQWLVKATPYDDAKGISSSFNATKGKAITLQPKAVGESVITMWPEGCPSKTTTIKIKTIADISGFTLSIPKDFSAGFKPGDTFNIVDSINTYLGGKVSRADNNLGDLSKYTDNKLMFSSNNNAIVSIDPQGTVTIKQVTSEKVPVVIVAYVSYPDGSKLEKNLTRDVAYPPLNRGMEATDASGASAVVTVAASTNNPVASVTYKKPAAGASTVTIGDTMVINGKTCKVTAIDPEAFKGNTSLTSVTISAGITEIPKDMFNGCTKLQTVTLPSTVEKIGEYAFNKCSSLTKVTIPKKVTKIDAYAFSGCSKLKTVTINAKGALVEIGKCAFNGCKVLTKITIPNKVTTIGEKAFYKCSKLKTITVKSSVITTVGKNAFKGIHKKATIKVPKKKLNDYKVLLKKGQAKTVKIKK